MSRVLGVVLLSAGLLVLFSLLLSPPAGADTAGLYAVAAGALAVGAASVIWARRARAWTVHTMFAAGAGTICLGMYFADAATGAYSVLFVWLVVIAASFFSPRAIAAHVVWILLASGLAMGTAGDISGISALARWGFGSLLLVVAATVMGWIVAGRRATERRLREEIAANARLQRELEHLAHHDPLTGLPNRRRLEQELARELARAQRRGTPLCLIALDLDELKAYNDANGHAAGDRVLKHAASTWAAALRATDLLARMGGDEFVALLPDCSADEAAHVVRRLRDSYPLGCSCSVGVACWDRRESADQLLTRADAAMYRDKVEAGSARSPTDRSARPDRVARG